MSDLDAAAELIAGAGALLICAGAGMGVDSGLPDFRGDEGFWRAYPPYARLGLRFEELADPRHFAEDPRLAWGFYGHRLKLYRETVPHHGFRILRDWGGRVPGGARVFTSNVDGQFQRAGFTAVAEAHGSIHHLQCLDGCTNEIWPADPVDVRIDEETMRAAEPLPSCPRCGGLARPNILMFGDSVFAGVDPRTPAGGLRHPGPPKRPRSWVPGRSQAQLDELTAWRRANRDVVVVELGAGMAVPTVRRYAELASASSGALIRINPREPAIRHGRGVSLAAGALDSLTALERRLAGNHVG